MSITPLADTSDLVDLYKPLKLFLKPTARVNISVALPQLKDPGQSISNWDLMERIKKMVHPIQFAAIKVAKSTIEFVRFEADVDNRQLMNKVIKTLDGSAIKVIGFYESLKVRAAEAKSDFPSRHDWDSFFRDAKNMNELRPGERPDTVYLAHLPCKWFQPKADEEDGDDAAEGHDPNLPSERILRRVFESFGEIRCVDIPACDPYRKDMSKTGLRTVGFSFGGELTFEGYVQFVEYISFVKAMDSLRNMKLVQFDEFGKAHQAHIKVDYDRSKHLSDKNIRRMRLERERLIEIERARKEEEERIRKEEEKSRSLIEADKSDRRRQREEKRRIKRLEQKRAEEERSLERRIQEEEMKLLIAQRKLESRRLLNQLFTRIAQEQLNIKEDEERSVVSLEDVSDEETEPVKKESEKRRELGRKEKRMRQTLLDDREKELRNKIRLKYEAKADESRRQRARSKPDSSTKHSQKRRSPSPSTSTESLTASDSRASSPNGAASSRSSVRTWNSDDEVYAKRPSHPRPSTQHHSRLRQPQPQPHRRTSGHVYDGRDDYRRQRSRPKEASPIRFPMKQHRHYSKTLPRRPEPQKRRSVVSNHHSGRSGVKSAVKQLSSSKKASDEGEIVDSDY